MKNDIIDFVGCKTYSLLILLINTLCYVTLCDATLMTCFDREDGEDELIYSYLMIAVVDDDKQKCICETEERSEA